MAPTGDPKAGFASGRLDLLLGPQVTLPQFAGPSPSDLASENARLKRKK